MSASEAKRLTTWLLDRCEARSLWFDPDGSPRPMTVNRLADRLRTDPEVTAKARKFKGPDTDLPREEDATGKRLDRLPPESRRGRR